MNIHLTLLAASVTTFAATNIDDFLILTLFFARRVPARRIVGGQYLGFSAIILLSLIGVVAALAIPLRWSRILGLLPLALGIKQLFAGRGRERAAYVNRLSVVSIAVVTLSNGADNVGVYVPFFLLNRPYIWFILISYGVFVGVWCLSAQWLGTYPVVLRAVDRWGHWLMPIVFIGLGVYILVS